MALILSYSGCHVYILYNLLMANYTVPSDAAGHGSMASLFGIPVILLAKSSFHVDPPMIIMYHIGTPIGGIVY